MILSLKNYPETHNFGKKLQDDPPSAHILNGMGFKVFRYQAAFLQGKPQPGRILAVKPVPELVKALQMKVDEVCKLEKGAYGLVDAPYLWYMAITEELQRLGFIQSPFDPCMYFLKHPKAGQLEGVLGLHVDESSAGVPHILWKSLLNWNPNILLVRRKFTSSHSRELKCNSYQTTVFT